MKQFIQNKLLITTFCGLVLFTSCLVNVANATLIPFQSFSGHVAMSTDGWGGLSDQGIISASAGVNSTVLAAYLYTATISTNSTPTVELDGNVVTFGPEVTNTSYTTLGSHRADVTTIVKNKIDNGVGGVYNFDIEETLLGNQVDGSALVVVYENALLDVATVGILDGFTDINGDTTAINFGLPLSPNAPGFFAEMVLGISYSCCDQASEVKVNGTTITSVAGNNDDGEDVSDGSLITVGGYDDPFTPSNPTYQQDHERYNLVPYITDGDTSININTNNPSNNDNIFLAGFYVSGVASFNEKPPTGVPEPSTLAIFALGMIGLASRRFKKQS
jgi:hypothetical protein